MKKLYLTGLLIIAISKPNDSIGQNFSVTAEIQEIVHKEEYFPIQFRTTTSWVGKKEWGFYIFTQNQKGFAQVFSGPKFENEIGQTKLEAGLGIGLQGEHEHITLKSNSFLELRLFDELFVKEKAKLILIGEYCSEEYYYLGIINFNLKNNIGLGFHAEYDACIGPRIELHDKICSEFLFLVGGANIEKGGLGLTFGFVKKLQPH